MQIALIRDRRTLSNAAIVAAVLWLLGYSIYAARDPLPVVHFPPPIVGPNAAELYASANRLVKNQPELAQTAPYAVRRRLRTLHATWARKEQLVAENGPALAELEKAQKLPYYVSEKEAYSDLGGLFNLSYVLRLAVSVDLHRGETKKALTDALRAVRLGLDQESASGTYGAYGTSILTSAGLSALRDAMQSATPAQALGATRSLYALANTRLPLPVMLEAVKWRQARDILAAMRKPTWYREVASTASTSFAATGTWTGGYPLRKESMDEYLAAMDLCIAESRKPFRAGTLKTPPVRGFLAPLLVPNCAATRTEDAGVRARLARAVTTAAVLTWQKQHGRIPDSLHALVPSVLPALPMDPLSATGEPVLHRKGKEFTVSDL